MCIRDRCVGKAEAAGRADGVDYRIVTGTAAFAPLLQQLRDRKSVV